MRGWIRREGREGTGDERVGLEGKGGRETGDERGGIRRERREGDWG